MFDFFYATLQLGYRDYLQSPLQVSCYLSIIILLLRNFLFDYCLHFRSDQTLLIRPLSLQPLMDNLEAQTYEIFEKDTCKYSQVPYFLMNIPTTVILWYNWSYVQISYPREKEVISFPIMWVNGHKSIMLFLLIIMYVCKVFWFTSFDKMAMSKYTSLWYFQLLILFSNIEEACLASSFNLQSLYSLCQRVTRMVAISNIVYHGLSIIVTVVSIYYIMAVSKSSC